MIVYPIMLALTWLSSLSRNQGDECELPKIPRTPCDPPDGCRAEHHLRFALRWLPERRWCEGVRDGDGDLYFVSAVMSDFPKLLRQNLFTLLV